MFTVSRVTGDGVRESGAEISLLRLGLRLRHDLRLNPIFVIIDNKGTVKTLNI